MTTTTAGQAGPEYLTTASVARRLGISPATVRAMLGTDLVGVRIGRVLRVEAASVDRYLAAQVVTSPAAGLAAGVEL
jgi:excisionase family DNA binding protein